jgi:8-amino-7-oxononanoate synthase
LDIFDRLLSTTLDRKNAIVREIVDRGQLYDRVCTAVRGRQIEVGGRWLADFASCNYLGLDLHPEVIDCVRPALERWGTHPSWARLACSPEPYVELEGRLARLLGTEDALVLPTVSLIAVGLIPALVKAGDVVFADRQVHKVNHDGCRLARDLCRAELRSFRHDDPEGLEAALAEVRDRDTRLVVVDGVLSVTGRVPALAEIVAVARRQDALVYIDDAHGFGVLGERPGPDAPFGYRGNGAIQHLGLGYDNVIYVAGLSKAYSSLAAFVACPARIKTALKCTVTSYIVSGPVPVASLATANKGLELNDRHGDAWRATLSAYTDAILAGYRAAGIPTDNDNGFPIVSATVGSPEAVLRGGQLLFDEGIFVTLQSYPLVPRDQGVLRATPTVANTWGEVEHLVEAMTRTVGRLRLEGLCP